VHANGWRNLFVIHMLLKLASHYTKDCNVAFMKLTDCGKAGIQEYSELFKAAAEKTLLLFTVLLFVLFKNSCFGVCM